MRLTKRNPETGLYEYVEKAKTQAEYNEQRKAVIQKLGEYEDRAEGQWVGEGDGYADGELVYDVWYCSECNYCIDDGTDDADLLPNYCPNCGAKMDGERRENGA